MPSPFLTPGRSSQPDTLAVLHLRRDQLVTTVLKTYDDENLGYDEGKVTNTRFGSYPHSTLLDQPWGSQIVASKVDTGSRGRRQQKRKADDIDSSGATEGARTPKTPVAAASGFIHLLPPTPESWTASLPHRTQVVYTPDYSYVLHRLRARPGSRIIEAGAGSGSFTHASVRAVFNGYPAEAPPTKRRRLGKVCSFEFHAQRVGRIQEEIKEHGLEGLVEVTHRDVYKDGFLVGDPKEGTSPKANAIFLDLPAPWLALPHLVREPSNGTESPLDPSSAVHICTFSPCLEQVQRTITTMRQLGWLNISMVEVQQRRIEVHREHIGLEYEGVRAATVFPKSVEESIAKLRTVEENAKRYRVATEQGDSTETPHGQTTTGDDDTDKGVADQGKQRPAPYNSGRLIHRTEPEIKTHTSYLLFAILPRAWSEEDEEKCRQTWPSRKSDAEAGKPKSRRQLKREERAQHKQEKAAEAAKKDSRDVAVTEEAGEKDVEMEQP
ncbi:tRNA (adenine-N(1)-)-methyltransferase catalytic subunit trm61 [Paecilomyces lecythidis]|uniref:tRNA (adenine(58)-N(1))-methyltransferase catalytic subunit TRM61 n=1 Tax=Paecilomyces lecythidis TaxID=3004212 RepID=A0ABR3WUD5_9EURO